MTNREKKKEMPDFNELTDRIIQETPKGPFIGVKTNLDPEDPEKFNPYRPGEEARS